MQPWMTADEVNEAIEHVLATSVGPDGAPATLVNIYLRQVREVDHLPVPIVPALARQQSHHGMWLMYDWNSNHITFMYWVCTGVWT